MHYSCEQNEAVSIIIRTTNNNRLELLRNCLKSVVSNDYRPIEIILVVQSDNQDFIDCIENIIKQFVSEQFYIKLVVNYTSKDERAKNLNLGIKNAQGRYIGFLDDDDIFYSHHLSSLIKEINRSESTFWAYSQTAMSVCRLENAKVNILRLDFPFKKEIFTLQDILKDNFIPIHSYLIDRYKFITDLIYFDETFSVLEDYEFLLRLIRVHKPSFINEVTCEYRFYTDCYNVESNIDIYSVLDYRDSKNSKIWFEASLRIEQIKKRLYPEYSPGLLSSNKRKFLISRFPLFYIIKKHFPQLWKVIKCIASYIGLM
jgi:glycosyltransferase involved in cell wall biosynthesis